MMCLWSGEFRGLTQRCKDSQRYPCTIRGGPGACTARSRFCELARRGGNRSVSVPCGKTSPRPRDGRLGPSGSTRDAVENNPQVFPRPVCPVHKGRTRPVIPARAADPATLPAIPAIHRRWWASSPTLKRSTRSALVGVSFPNPELASFAGSPDWIPSCGQEGRKKIAVSQTPFEVQMRRHLEISSQRSCQSDVAQPSW